MGRFGLGGPAVVLSALLVSTAVRPQPVRAAGPKADEVREVRKQVDQLLKTELVQHWYPHAVDRELGGFHENFARDWTPRPDRDRFLVYQSRMTWTAAAFALASEPHREEYKRYARHGIEYLDRVMRDREAGGFHWMLDPQGKVDHALGAEKHVYGTAFVVYAASKAREATGDDLALKVARDAFDWLEAHAHDAEHGGYFEALTRDGKPILGWKEGEAIARRQDRLGVYYGFKSMNSHIHLLEALAALAHVDPSPLVRTRLRETLEIVRDRIAAEPGVLILYLTRDWRPTAAHDSFGHDVETAYLLVEAAEALGIPDDPKTWRVARSLLDHALDWGWDDEHGGFYDKGDAFAARAYDTTKVWWTQAEGLNALLWFHAKYGGETERYWQAFRKQWAFITRHQIDPVHGGWFGEVTREGKLMNAGDKATPWKANYHTSRALMNVAAKLGEIERAGVREAP